MNKQTLWTLAVSLFSVAMLNADDSEVESRAPLVEKYLIQGNLKEGERALKARLAERPGDAQAQMGLGTLHFLQAIERLGQSLHKYGAHAPRQSFLWTGTVAIPVFRMPVPANGDPEEITYEAAREILKQLLVDLAKADASLQRAVKHPSKLPLHFGIIRLDLNGNGRGDEGEELWRIYSGLMNRRLARSSAAEFVVTLDVADMHWMRGYCHLISTFAEVLLAYDWHELLETSGEVLFAKVKSPYPPLKDTGIIANILDDVAMVHLIRWPIKEPERMSAALNHLKVVIAESRVTWDLIEGEMDDDHEWIPNPRQKGVIPGVRITPEMITTWRQFLDEAEAILKGKKLIPFWRGKEKIGVNLERVFTEPRELDAILWMQGSAATAYCEEGELSSPATWARFQSIFRGQFIGFVAWFN